MFGARAAEPSLKLSLSNRVVQARRASVITELPNTTALDDDDDAADASTPRTSATKRQELDKVETAFQRCADTQVGRFFTAIIAKFGARFPAVEEELKVKLPLLTEEGAKLFDDNRLLV